MRSTIKKISSYTLLFATAFLVACGPLTEELPWVVVDEKQDQTEEGGGSVSVEIMEGELMNAMGQMVSFQEHSYQYNRNNTTDVFAGYIGVSQNNFLFGGPLPSTYSFPNPYYQSTASLNSLPAQLKNTFLHAESLDRHAWKAIAQIMYVYTARERIDAFGPFPYEDTRDMKQNPPINYEPEDELYSKMFKELKEAIAVLKERKPTPTDISRISNQWGGLCYGDWQYWVKFANSIRISMALTLSKIDPATAKAEYVAAASDEIGPLGPKTPEIDGYLGAGVFGPEYRDFSFNPENGSINSVHPIYFIGNSWGDCRLGASMENIMKRQRNPLLSIWWDKNPYAIKNSQGKDTGIGPFTGYYGIRQGVAMINKSDNKSGYGMYSVFKVTYFPKHIMRVTEVMFNRAEAALRGWETAGTAQAWYEAGIKRIFQENEQYGLTVLTEYPKYLSVIDQGATPATAEERPIDPVDYVDYYNQINNIKGRVTIGVKWNDGDSKEKKLERIITQKYIATFPVSTEAWRTFRRTGYPRLFPIPANMNNWDARYGKIDIEVQLRRIPYEETTNNASDINGSLRVALEKLGKSNRAESRLWWDVDTDKRSTDPATKGQVVPVNF